MELTATNPTDIKQLLIINRTITQLWLDIIHQRSILQAPQLAIWIWAEHRVWQTALVMEIWYGCETTPPLMFKLVGTWLSHSGLECLPVG